MKCFLLTHIGGESVAATEIKEILEREGEKTEGGVFFEVEAYEELFKLSYFSQSALNILLLDYEAVVPEGATFAIRGDNIEKAATIINKGGRYTANLKNPDYAFISYNNIVGLDFSGDLSKREFRVFTNRHTIKGTVAYILLREAGYTGNETLLDPFAKDGTIPLEAVHYATNRSIHYYEREKFHFLKFKKFSYFDFDEFFDSFEEKELEKPIYVVSTDLRDISATKKNAKIAGVQKKFTFSRQDTEWLGLKFDEPVDLLVTHLPKLPEKQQEIFFEQAKQIAKKVVLLTNNGKGKVIHVGKTKKIIMVL